MKWRIGQALLLGGVVAALAMPAGCQLPDAAPITNAAGSDSGASGSGASTNGGERTSSPVGGDMDGPAYASFKDLAVALGSDGLQTALGTGFGASNAVKTWLKVEDTGPTNSGGALTITFVPSAAWTGTIYLDQADFTPT